MAIDKIMDIVRAFGELKKKLQGLFLTIFSLHLIIIIVPSFDKVKTLSKVQTLIAHSQVSPIRFGE
mgnify:CR=1 FL=1